MKDRIEKKAAKYLKQKKNPNFDLTDVDVRLLLTGFAMEIHKSLLFELGSWKISSLHRKGQIQNLTKEIDEIKDRFSTLDFVESNSVPFDQYHQEFLGRERMRKLYAGKIEEISLLRQEIDSMKRELGAAKIQHANISEIRTDALEKLDAEKQKKKELSLELEDVTNQLMSEESKNHSLNAQLSVKTKKLNDLEWLVKKGATHEELIERILN